MIIDTSWRQGMSNAYANGLADGKRGRRWADATRGGGFDACYWQGFGHGARECICPERLAGKRQSQVCVVCGMRRHG